MPTKRRRHAITETPPVEAALDELREELNGERVDLGELVVLGARQKLELLRKKRDQDQQVLGEFARAIRNRELTPIDLEVAAEARRGRTFD